MSFEVSLSLIMFLLVIGSFRWLLVGKQRKKKVIYKRHTLQ